MRRGLAALLPALLCIAGDGDPAGALMDRVQAHYAEVRDLRADFEQRAHIASLDRDEVSRGDVVVQRPGRMRWEYREPEARTIVLDGETLRVWIPGERQLQIARLDSGAVSPTALGFLLGEGSLRASFEGRLLPPRDGAVGLSLLPRSDQSFERLELWVDPERLELRESVVVDLVGNTTRLVFRNLRENQGVDAKFFLVEVPDDAEVIDLR